MVIELSGVQFGLKTHAEGDLVVIETSIQLTW